LKTKPCVRCSKKGTLTNMEDFRKLIQLEDQDQSCPFWRGRIQGFRILPGLGLPPPLAQSLWIFAKHQTKNGL
jgi:hypothetical protein